MINSCAVLKMGGVKTVSYAASAMALALVICAATLANASGNISETTNSTDPSKTDYSKGDGFLTWQLKVCLVIAGLVTVIGLVLCLYIRTKAENSYAIGANVPKPLGGMPDDY